MNRILDNEEKKEPVKTDFNKIVKVLFPVKTEAYLNKEIKLNTNEVKFAKIQTNTLINN